MPRIERLHQNTAEWHRWRRQGIGASDAPVIMGETPFKTPRTLWSIKTGRMQEGPAGPAARRGRELERFARRAYERRTGIQVEPLCLVHHEFEWMRASLDGLSFDGSTLLEIKCPLSLAGSRISRAGSYPFPVPCAAAASTGGLRSRPGALLVLPRERRNPGRDTPRPGIREETGRGGGRVLAAGEGKPLARTGQRGTGPECGSKMASRRAPLPRSQAPAGKRSIRGAQAARNAQAYGDSEADVRLWRRSLEELAQRRG